MKKRWFAAAALLLLLLALALNGSAEGFETPLDTATSYIGICWRTLWEDPAAPEASDAFPELLEQICGFLNVDSAAAGDLRTAMDALRRGDSDAAQKALRLAERKLKEDDIIAPFVPGDLPAAARYGLMPIEDVKDFVRVFSEKAGAAT